MEIFLSPKIGLIYSFGPKKLFFLSFKKRPEIIMIDAGDKKRLLSRL